MSDKVLLSAGQNVQQTAKLFMHSAHEILLPNMLLPICMKCLLMNLTKHFTETQEKSAQCLYY